jgi:PncC family amidohydrolase
MCILFSDVLITYAEELLAKCRRRGVRVTTAESCTGGMIATLLTHIPGSSDVFEGGFITYSNQLKIALLGVGRELLLQKGAVSMEVAKQMAVGALYRSQADISVSVTGIAGPTGATPDKPLGLVYIAVASKFAPTQGREFHFSGGRTNIRLSAVREALRMIQKAI